MTKREIDKMCVKYKKGLLSKDEIKWLANSIANNKKTSEMAIGYLLKTGQIHTALKFVNSSPTT